MSSAKAVDNSESFPTMTLEGFNTSCIAECSLRNSGEKIIFFVWYFSLAWLVYPTGMVDLIMINASLLFLTASFITSSIIWVSKDDVSLLKSEGTQIMIKSASWYASSLFSMAFKVRLCSLQNALISGSSMLDFPELILSIFYLLDSKIRISSFLANDDAMDIPT